MPAEMKTSLLRGDFCLVSIDEYMVALNRAERQVPMQVTVHDQAMITKARRSQQAGGGG